MLLSVVLFALLGISHALDVGLNKLVRNGHPVKDMRLYPYMVYIEGYEGDCSGTLLSPTHILTNAHCSVGINFDYDNYAHAGYFNAPKGKGIGKQVRKIVKMTMNPDYKSGNVGHDVAVLEVDKPFVITKHVNLTKIPDSDFFLDFISEDGQILGWGITVNGTNQPLQVGSTQIFGDRKECQKMWEEFCAKSGKCVCSGKGCDTAVTENEVCTLGKSQITVGDSGGPLIFRFSNVYQVGISTRTSGQNNVPDLSVRASKHCSWIAQTTNNAFKCSRVY
ncbi:hypothetical protein L596_017711 [Steinernema carpocapsae]|uniref:Peptidase S1 domain-containing protein n=1 Tax=Steinernema carpocapsae TaxID=34508 RepID=A0A4V6A1T5_STECR|nr:hypothetical protein L596_017711 [Steinernema carpocapsae]